MYRTLCAPVLLLSLNGCIAMDVPDEIEYSATRSVFGMGCNKPFELTFGCNAWSIANIDYGEDETRVNLSSTEDGKVLIVMNNEAVVFSSAVIEGLTLFTLDPEAIDLGKEVMVLIEELESKGMEIEDVQVISNVLDVSGYILFTDGDALAALGLRQELEERRRQKADQSDQSTD